jgi:mannose-1-phosphate guanylyltransferase
MHVQSVPSSKILIRPVILAAGSQRRLWPLSTPETPFCLRSVNHRPPLLVRTLLALEANPSFGVPIVILAESAARLGVTEITRARPDASIILVPQSIGSGISSLLAVTAVTNSCASRLMALIPASFAANDPVEAFRSLASVASQCADSDHPILMARRSATPDNAMHIELGERLAQTALFGVKNIQVSGSSEIATALAETQSLVSKSGPALVSTQNLLKHIQANFPTTFVACHNAMHLAEKFGNTQRPQQDFLSFGGRPGILDYFQSVLPNIRVFIGNPDWRTIETFRDPLFDEHKSLPATPIGISGFSGCRVFSSDDGVLILKPGHEDEVKEHYPDTSATNGFNSGPPRKGPSLRFTA